MILEMISITEMVGAITKEATSIAEMQILTIVEMISIIGMVGAIMIEATSR